MAHFKNEEGDPKSVLTSEGVVYVNPGEELEYEEPKPEKPKAGKVTSSKPKSKSKKK